MNWVEFAQWAGTNLGGAALVSVVFLIRERRLKKTQQVENQTTFVQTLIQERSLLWSRIDELEKKVNEACRDLARAQRALAKHGISIDDEEGNEDAA